MELERGSEMTTETRMGLIAVGIVSGLLVVGGLATVVLIASQPAPKTHQVTPKPTTAVEPLDPVKMVLGIVLLGTLALLGVALWLMPIVIAVMRKHPNLAAIVVIDLLLGWLFVGWVVALAMALTSPVTMNITLSRDE